jgi:hypothetical protein
MIRATTLFISLSLMAQTFCSERVDLNSYRELPRNYQSLSACEKQDILWDKIEQTEHQELPMFSRFGALQLMKMGVQSMTKKAERNSDISPENWEKLLHKRGSVAQVEFQAEANHDYTGVFKGAECALIRLSLTYRPTNKRDFAPGLALKFFRDAMPSANISALYRLEGQEKDYNFFANPLSNIVPIGNNAGLKLVNKIFKRVTDYPEQLGMLHLGHADEHGISERRPKTPRQIFFVPVLEDSFSSAPHDVRHDFHRIPEGTTLYKVYAVNEELKHFDYSEYTSQDIERFVQNAQYIGKIVTKTRFISSEFGDQGLFFRHEVLPKK